MKKRSLSAVLFLLLLAGAFPARSQPQQEAPRPAPGPLRGIVWEEPAEPVQAEEELIRLYRSGVRAVRTGLVRHPNVFVLADTLGMQLFQELPLDYLPAPLLRDTLASAAELLAATVARARAHPSARNFGLARRSDTSDPAACAFFETLTRNVHAQLPDARTYYVSPFVASDRCTGSVDFVLLDVLDASDPVERLEQWQEVHGAAGPAGIGALGTWAYADSSRLRGLRADHSPEVQARYLEHTLRTLLYDGDVPARAVFVYRWQDLRPDGERRKMQPGYGLIDAEGNAGPAFQVVRGLYTGAQTVFAFSTGNAPEEGLPWLILLGWGVVGVLGVSYALSSRFRHMVPRYFLAHGFYRESVREGREVQFAGSVVVLVVLAASAGMLWSVVIGTLQQEAPLRMLLHWMGEAPLAAGNVDLIHPPFVVAGVAALFAVGVLWWAVVLVMLARGRYRIAAGQALMLVLWPQWLLLVLMVGALVVTTLPQEEAVRGGFILGAGALLVLVVATLRTLWDFAVVTRVPAQRVLLAFVLHPLVVLAVPALFFLIEMAPQAAFFWHLAFRG